MYIYIYIYIHTYIHIYILMSGKKCSISVAHSTPMKPAPTMRTVAYAMLCYATLRYATLR